MFHVVKLVSHESIHVGAMDAVEDVLLDVGIPPITETAYEIFNFLAL